MLIGILATTNSGLANARNCTDLTLGVLEVLDVLRVILPTKYLDTFSICTSLSPVPVVCAITFSKELSEKLFKDSNFVDTSVYTCTCS